MFYGFPGGSKRLPPTEINSLHPTISRIIKITLDHPICLVQDRSCFNESFTRLRANPEHFLWFVLWEIFNISPMQLRQTIACKINLSILTWEGAEVKSATRGDCSALSLNVITLFQVRIKFYISNAVFWEIYSQNFFVVLYRHIYLL